LVKALTGQREKDHRYRALSLDPGEKKMLRKKRPSGISGTGKGTPTRERKRAHPEFLSKKRAPPRGKVFFWGCQRKKNRTVRAAEKRACSGKGSVTGLLP